MVEHITCNFLAMLYKESKYKESVTHSDFYMSQLEYSCGKEENLKHLTLTWEIIMIRKEDFDHRNLSHCVKKKKKISL